MSDYFGIPPILGIGGLLVAFVIYHIMTRHNHGDGKVKHIGDQIALGAMVFMHREYKMLLLFAVIKRINSILKTFMIWGVVKALVLVLLLVGQLVFSLDQ